jgi:hypothetical protein
MSGFEIFACVVLAIALNGAAALWIAACSDLEPEEAFWWPIHIFKGLLRGLVRSLIEGWLP